MRNKYFPVAAIAALAAVAIYFFAIRPDVSPVETGRERLFLVPVAPVGPVSEPPEEFRWRSLESAHKYEVEVFNSAMISLWIGDTKETSIAFPLELSAPLLGGETLFFQVSAKGKYGKALVSSTPVLFRLSDPIETAGSR